MRIDRLLAITVLLLGRDRVTAAELAEKFEVSVRTVYRDIEAMSMAGIPVVPYSGNGGGYSLIETYKLDRRLLKTEDIRAIMSSLSGLNRTLGDRHMQSALDKIGSLLPRGSGPQAPSLCEQLVIDLFPWNQNPAQVDTIRTVHQAISETRLLHFHYQNSHNESGRRRVEPMTLVFKGYGWYLFAFCTTRNDFRFFKLSRMSELAIAAETFARRPAGYQSYLPEKKNSGNSYQLVLEFAAEMAPFLEDSFPQEPKAPQENGSIRITLTVPQDDWVLGMILSYGPYVRVIEPDTIRDQVVSAAKKILGANQT